MFLKSSGIGKFMHEREEVSRFSVDNYLSHSIDKLRVGTKLSCF